MSNSDKVNILIVDDQPDKLLSLEVALESLGENLVKASSGREALRRMLDQEFAVVLLDVSMPDMDGFETARLMRQHPRCAATPIIFVTAHSDDMLTQGYSLGAVDYMLSPIVPDILRTKVSVFAELFRRREQIRRQAESEMALAREQAARAAAEEATRRASFLADVTGAMAQSLDARPIIDILLRHAVPRFVDFCAVSLLDDGGGYATHILWIDEHNHPQSLVAGTSAFVPASWRASLAAVMEGRLSEALLTQPSAADSTCDASTSTAHQLLPLFAPLGWDQSTGIVVPLRASDRMLGAVTFVMGRSGRTFQPADLVVARDMAARASTALEKSRLYQEIQENDRRKNEFLAMLAHELRNPLAPIRNAVEILRHGEITSDNLHWVQDVIDRQVQQLVRLVDDLLDISRITRGKIKVRSEPIEVNEIVQRAIEMSRPLVESREQVLHANIARDEMIVGGDPIRLVQVIGNLLNNASKYTEKGGEIWVTTVSDGDRIKIRVRDSGVGIPANMLRAIFDLFMQVDHSLDRSQGGLGIGLTLVRSLVQMHGGEVEAFSPGANQGSEFVVTLPRLKVIAAEPSSDRNFEQPEAPQNCRVLVVDDNIDSAQSLSMLLQLRGHSTSMAHNGLAALDSAEQFRPDLILLDIGLPGMDGYEVARRLRRHPDLRRTVIAALTGYGRAEDVKLSREAGFDHHLVKPVDVRRLDELFNSLAVPAST